MVKTLVVKVVKKCFTAINLFIVKFSQLKTANISPDLPHILFQCWIITFQLCVLLCQVYWSWHFIDCLWLFMTVFLASTMSMGCIVWNNKLPFFLTEWIINCLLPAKHDFKMRMMRRFAWFRMRRMLSIRLKLASWLIEAIFSLPSCSFYRALFAQVALNLQNWRCAKHKFEHLY